jgi:hypothetical protein
MKATPALWQVADQLVSDFTPSNGIKQDIKAVSLNGHPCTGQANRRH